MITGTDKNPSFGLAADGKPANVPNGHLHVEIDTFKASLYDEENNNWYEDAGGGGGSGLPDYSEASEGDVLSIDSNGDPAWAPPSGGGALVVTANYSGASTGATPAEIRAAATAGTPLYIKWGNTTRPAVLATDEITQQSYLESQFVSMGQDPQTGDWTVYATRWRIQLLTSSLSQVYSASAQLTLYTDNGGVVEGGEL